MARTEWWRIALYIALAGAVVALYPSGMTNLLDVCVIGALALLFTLHELRP